MQMVPPQGDYPSSTEVCRAESETALSDPSWAELVIGTYTRTTALDILIDSFLEDISSQEKQIVSLGAGTDTRPFHLFDEQSLTRLIYHELDFETTSRKKLHIVQTRPQVKKILGEVSTEDDGASWSSKPAAGGEYYCHGLDLRSLRVTKTVPEQPQIPGPELEPPEPADAPPPPVVLPGLRTDIPTLLLSECCLCYLSPLDASDVLAYFTSRIPNLATVIYEPINPSDAFGQMMVSNLAARRIRMPTLSVFREAADQVARLRHAGFETVESMTILDIWKSWVEPEEKRRLDMLEGLDEVEEWELLAGHYIVVWGFKGDGFSRWRSLGKTA